MREEKDIIQEQQTFGIKVWEFVSERGKEEAFDYIDSFDFEIIADFTQEEIIKYKKDIKKAIEKSFVDGEGFRFFKFATKVCTIDRKIIKKFIRQQRIIKSWEKTM